MKKPGGGARRGNATAWRGDAGCRQHIPIHALRAERDDLDPPYVRSSRNFNPRAPCGARPCCMMSISIIKKFQPTRSVRSATFAANFLRDFLNISTHALRAERDSKRHYVKHGDSISTHALRAERDFYRGFCRLESTDFNPRAPCGARPARGGHDAAQRDFNPRAPCGARPVQGAEVQPRPRISTHALRAERDAQTRLCRTAPAYFNPRAPCGARLAAGLHAAATWEISTHALRAERDKLYVLAPSVTVISTHALRAERDFCRLSGRLNDIRISTHALRAERDSLYCCIPSADVNFNPRAPCGARL